MTAIRFFVFKTVIAGALLVATCLVSHSSIAVAQNENYSNLTLGLSGSPAEAHPRLTFFTRNGFEPQFHTLESVPGKGLILDAIEAAGPCMMVQNEARAIALCLGNYGVGIGTFNPMETLHVYSDDFSFDAGGNPIGFDQARILVENNKSATAMRTMLELVNNGPSRMVFDNVNSNNAWAIQTGGQDQLMLSLAGTSGPEFIYKPDGTVMMGPGNTNNFILAPNGNLTIKGALNQQSDRHQKESFAQVDADDILQKVAALEITSWKYKDDQQNVRHIGPMAQDFHAVYQVGPSDRTISSIDTAGVSLVAIQALTSRLQEKEERIRQLEDQMQQLMAIVSSRQ